MASSLFPNQNPIARIKTLINSTKNPQALIETMTKNNPQLQTVLTMVQNSNKSPKDIFYEMAQKNGLNPDEIVSQLK